MGMLETAYEIKDIADVMVASEGNIPNSGWDYESGFAKLASSSGKLDAKTFAKSITTGFRDFSCEYISSGRAINISAYDLTKTKQFANTINLIAGELYQLLCIDQKVPSVLERTIFREKILDSILKSHYYTQTFMHNQAVDILDFINNIIRNIHFLCVQEAKLEKKFAKLFKHCGNLPAEHNDFVIESCSSGAEYQFSRGVSLFFPWTQIALGLLSNEYRNLKFDKQIGNWRKLFEKYVELTMRAPEDQSFLYMSNQTVSEDSFAVRPELENSFVEFANAKDATGREYIGREYIGREYIGREYIGREYIGREYIGREYIGREYIGRGQSFYSYFDGIRNFAHFKKKE